MISVSANHSRLEIRGQTIKKTLMPDNLPKHRWAFWSHVGSILPNWEARKAWLGEKRACPWLEAKSSRLVNQSLIDVRTDLPGGYECGHRRGAHFRIFVGHMHRNGAV